MSIRRNPVLRESSHLLIPAILIFALYVQFHGDYGPGGGFQAGVIFASAIILYALLHGTRRAEKIIPLKLARTFAALGILIYTCTGILGIILGGNFLNYNVLAHDPIHGQHWGILLIELGVGITVGSVIISIFYAFAKFKQ